MVSERDINDIQSLRPEEQRLVISLVRSFINCSEERTDAQKWFSSERKNYVQNNPLTMEQIDSIIHEGD